MVIFGVEYVARYITEKRYNQVNGNLHVVRDYPENIVKRLAKIVPILEIFGRYAKSMTRLDMTWHWTK